MTLLADDSLPTEAWPNIVRCTRQVGESTVLLDFSLLALPWTNGCWILSGFWIPGFRALHHGIGKRIDAAGHRISEIGCRPLSIRRTPWACGFFCCCLDNRSSKIRLARPCQNSSLVHQSAAPFDRGICTKCIHFLGHFHPIRSWNYGMERPPQGNQTSKCAMLQFWFRIEPASKNFNFTEKNNENWANRWSMSSFKQHQTFLGFHIARSTWRSWAAKSRRTSPRLPRCRNGGPSEMDMTHSPWLKELKA